MKTYNIEKGPSRDTVVKLVRALRIIIIMIIKGPNGIGSRTLGTRTRTVGKYLPLYLLSISVPVPKKPEN